MTERLRDLVSKMRAIVDARVNCSNHRADESLATTIGRLREAALSLGIEAKALCQVTDRILQIDATADSEADGSNAEQFIPDVERLFNQLDAILLPS